MKNKHSSFKNEKIIIKNLDKLIGEKFGDYSKYIIQERALPDLRDGLKPVQRRILFAMNQLKLNYDTNYKKSARIVGDVIGKYHPHGDTSVYDALIRMSQGWKSSIPLIDMHGNNGSIDGDSAAAMRYTEARLSKISFFLMQDIEKKIVPFTNNFDDSELEPVILPAKIPNLLINGAIGIASGYSTNIPPHNFTEVINALIYALKNENFSVSDLRRIIHGPDFPTGGIIESKLGIKEAYHTGKGKIVIKANVISDQNNNQIIIDQIPFEVNKADLVRKIDEFIIQDKIPGLISIRDDTDRNGLQMTLSTRKNVNHDAIINFLFKNTDLRKNYYINMIVIKDKKPQLVTLVNIIDDFKEFQFLIYQNLFKYELDKYQKRLLVIKALIQISSDIDMIIDIIKSSLNKSEAKLNLIKKYKFNDYQAEAIVNLRLYRLTATDIGRLIDEHKSLLNLINHYQKGLKDKKYLAAIIITDLNKIKEQFKIKRRSLIKDKIEEISISEKELVIEDFFYLCLTKKGYIKLVSTKSKSSSNVEHFTFLDGDIPISKEIKVSNLNNLFLFTSKGKFYRIPIYKLNQHKYKDIGDHLSKYISITTNETIISFTLTKKNIDNLNLNFVIATKRGVIKQTKFSNLNFNVSKAGQKFIKLEDDDSVVAINFVKTNQKYVVITFTENGYYLQYNLDKIPTTNFNSIGVKNIKLLPFDYVLNNFVILQKDFSEGKSKFLIFTKLGKGKRIRAKDLKEGKRNLRGNLILRQVKAYEDKLIGVYQTDFEEKVNIMYSNNKIKLFENPNEIILSDLISGFSKFSNKKIKLIQNDLYINFKQFLKEEILKSRSKVEKLDIEEILKLKI
ncbi:MAG: DNA topoisomerase 4 subunit A [Candidatus Hepatoplasma scabrum]|nr:MAG: DNA topoisomerase 4 subunit A [Candidatus Hepatoplasma sp.]